MLSFQARRRGVFELWWAWLMLAVPVGILAGNALGGVRTFDRVPDEAPSVEVPRPAAPLTPPTSVGLAMPAQGAETGANAALDRRSGVIILEQTPDPKTVPVTPPPLTAPPQTLPPPPPVTIAAAPPVPAKVAGGIFGEGRLRVGTDVKPGRYVALRASDCTVVRFGPGANPVVLGTAQLTAQALLDVLPTDGFVDTSGCGGFRPLGPLSAASMPTVVDGAWLVGAQMVPGTWRSAGGAQCSWQRVSDFTWSTSSVVESGDGSSGMVSVTLAPSDAGFASRGCGSWTRVTS